MAKAKKILVLCATPYSSIHIDRRVLNQCALWIKRGWDVDLCIPHDKEDKVEYVFGDNIKINISTSILNHQIYCQGITYVYDLLEVPKSSIRAKISNLDRFFLDYDLEDSIVMDRLGNPKNEIEFENFKKFNNAWASEPIGGKFFLVCFFMSILEKNDFDMVLCQDYQSILAANIFCTKAKKKYMIDFHEFCLSYKRCTLSEQKIVKYIEGNAIKNALTITTISDLFADLYRVEYGLDYLPYPIYNTPYSVADSIQNLDIRKMLNLDDSRKLVMFHGAISSQRNLENIIDASESLIDSNISILFLGYGENKLIEQIKNTKNSYYLDAVSQDTLITIIEQVDAILVPHHSLNLNLKFCVPNRFFDAVNHKKKIILNEDLVYLKKIVETYKLGVVGEMNNPSDMSKIIKNAIFEYDESQGQWDEVIQTYGYKKQIENYNRIIDFVEHSLDVDENTEDKPKLNYSDVEKNFMMTFDSLLNDK